jgi:aspartate-semialdehyde dehydrogenase
MQEDVPLLVPEINPDHLGLLAVQRQRGWSGGIITNPNCAAVVAVLPFAALRPFGLQRAVLTTFQAVSGAGYPGVPSLDILGNVIPYIGSDEERKVETEIPKILGSLTDGAVRPLPFALSASCNRVPSIDGHLVVASFELAAQVTRAEIEAALTGFRGLPQERRLPSAPLQPIHLLAGRDRPQPRRDSHIEGGMATAVGRLRECPVLGWKFAALAHNVLRGAAGAAVLNAELMRSEGLLS